MKPTALGALLAGVGWLALLVGFVIGATAPAMLGVVLIGGVETTRWRLQRCPVQVHREQHERLALGDTTTLRVHVTAERPLPLWVEDDVDVPLRVTARRHPLGIAQATSELDVKAVEVGTARLGDVQVHVADPWALHTETRSIPAPARIAIAPEADWLEQGHQAGRRHTIQTLVKGRRSHETLPQVETIREFQPGDRLRDVDWARTSRFGGLHTRVRERVTPRPFLILLDATASMRYYRRRAKMTSGAQLAYGLVAAAQAAGVQARIVAFDESGHSSLGAGRRSEAMERLASLDSAVPVTTIPGIADGYIGTDRAQRGFLGAISALSAGRTPPSPALEGAVARLTHGAPDQALVVAILDGEAAPEATEAAVQRLRRAGHDCILILPASGAHHYRRSEGEAVLPQLQAWQAARERLQRRLGPRKVSVLSLTPHNVPDLLQEVAKSAE